MQSGCSQRRKGTLGKKTLVEFSKGETFKKELEGFLEKGTPISLKVLFLRKRDYRSEPSCSGFGKTSTLIRDI